MEWVRVAKKLAVRGDFARVSKCKHLNGIFFAVYLECVLAVVFSQIHVFLIALNQFLKVQEGGHDSSLELVLLRGCWEPTPPSHTTFLWPLRPANSPCGACDLRARPGKRVTHSWNTFVRLLTVFNLSCATCNQNRNCSDAERLVPDEIVTGNTSSSDLVFAMCEGEKSVLVRSFIHSAFKSWNNLSLCLFN